jgi:hypothetical protein
MYRIWYFLHRKEGKAITKARPFVVCYLDTLSWISENSYCPFDFWEEHMARFAGFLFGFFLWGGT